jgi:uncharacterized protein (TIGR02246 family)
VADNDSPPTLAELRAGITQTVEHFSDAWNRHDARALAATFGPDADFTNVVGAHIRGRDKILDAHAKLFSGVFKQSRQTSIVRSIRMLSLDLAAVDLDWEMEGLRGPDGAARPVRRGLMSWVVFKAPAEPWRIMIMHNSELTSAAR